MKKAMHANHADNTELIELSGHVFGCENAWPMKGAAPSACFACITFLHLR
jgi:hypothetical protein